MTSELTDADRRAFLLGRLRTGGGSEPPAEHHISSLVVHALPDMLDRVSAALAALDGIEIHARDPKGKLILTLETADDATIVERLNDIHGIRGVLSAALVFHHFEQTTTQG
jgi:periplasmic nitrate reductase NapD